MEAACVAATETPALSHNSSQHYRDKRYTQLSPAALLLAGVSLHKQPFV